MLMHYNNNNNNDITREQVISIFIWFICTFNVLVEGLCFPKDLWYNTNALMRYIASHLQWTDRVRPQVIHTTSDAASCGCHSRMVTLVTMANGSNAT